MGQLQQSQACWFWSKNRLQNIPPSFRPINRVPIVSLPRQNGHHQYSHRAARGSPQRSERSGSVPGVAGGTFRFPMTTGMLAGCQIPIFGFFEFQWSSESVWKIMSKVPIHLWMGWKERLLKNDVLEIRGHKAPLKKSHGRVGIPVSKRLSSI